MRDRLGRAREVSWAAGWMAAWRIALVVLGDGHEQPTRVRQPSLPTFGSVGAWAGTHGHTPTLPHTHAHAHTRTHARTHARTDTYTHTHASMHTRMHTHTHARIHTHTHPKLGSLTLNPNHNPPPQQVVLEEPMAFLTSLQSNVAVDAKTLK